MNGYHVTKITDLFVTHIIPILELPVGTGTKVIFHFLFLSCISLIDYSYKYFNYLLHLLGFYTRERVSGTERRSELVAGP